MTQEDIIAHIEANKLGPLCKVDLPDVAIEAIIDLMNSSNYVPEEFKVCIIRQTTKAQFFTLNQSIKESFPELVLKTKDGTIEDYQDLLSDIGGKPLSTYDLMYVKFWTDEEIRANPELFFPGTFNKAQVVYYSRETLTVLNKHYGKRFKYNNAVNSLMRIVGNRTYNKMSITDEDFLYIAEKTGASNEEIINVLASKGKFMKKEFLRKLLPIIEFTQVNK